MAVELTPEIGPRKLQPEDSRTDIATSYDNREQRDEAGDPEAGKEKQNNPLSTSSSYLYNSGVSKHGFKRFFEIRPSRLGGLGAFAVRELRKGDVILVEKPLLLSDNFGLRSAFDKLSEAEKEIYLNLHCGDNCTQFNKIEKIKQRNSFHVLGRVVAIFATASRFNHACKPARNVKYVIDGETGVVTLTVCKDVIPAGTELTVNYGGSPAQLYRDFGFICKCGGCGSLTGDDIKRMRNEQLGIYS
ncbi:hypothetical protein MFIFM68171_00432 [Madurella fahalii]|uniref:SET domain-containing protein n=1 Tax=Madurella fahalii TaxID=1157608 RepID=A0ABQ0FXI4_9PEZI